ncbi:MAG: hypothetical protein K2J76_06105, partial [Oscillospiraceae bacterium]|nr:hypothetical protein [Oscillospiraceae bacterium]
NIKILNEAVSSIIAIADSVSDDRRERSMVYHLLKFIRAAVRDFPQNTNDNTADLLNAYAAKIKRFTDGKLSRFVTLELHANYEKSEVIPMPITNANEAILHLIRKNLQEKNRDNYASVHKIADLYLRRFFEYSDWLDARPYIENWDVKQALLCAFSAEMGLHIGWLEDAMRNNGLKYDDIIV